MGIRADSGLASSSNKIALVIVPASGEEAKRHFRKTVEKLWSLSDILSLGVDLPERLEDKLRKVDRFAIWGSTPRVRGIESLFRRLEESGEGFVAFYQDGMVVCWGRIFAWTRNAVLAERLWGRDRQGDTWEYIYFIRDVRHFRPGIPWSVVRDKLGYSRGFFPRGHTFVPIDRVKSIIKEYGDILSFFDALANVEASRIKGQGDDVLRKYNPYLVQSLKRLDPAALLAVLGETARALKSTSADGVSKDAVIEILRKVLESLGRSTDVAYVASRQYPLLINDLRRLGLLDAGNPIEEWTRDVKARVSHLVHRIVDVIEYCKTTCADMNRCRVIGGAVAVVSLLGGVPAGSPGLRRVLIRLYVGEPLEKIAKDVASEINASTERVLEVIKAMKRLVEESINVLVDAINNNCIPRFYVPLGLRLTNRHTR